jgi:Sodium:sulfate symporter transmembrane region.
MSTWQVVATLLLVTAIVRTMFSTASAAVIIILPIMIEFAETLALDPLFMGFSVMFLIGATTFLPFNTTAVLLSHDRGPLSIPEVFRFGVVTAALAVVVLVVAWVGYWPLVLDGLSPIG